MNGCFIFCLVLKQPVPAAVDAADATAADVDADADVAGDAVDAAAVAAADSDDATAAAYVDADGPTQKAAYRNPLSLKQSPAY